MHCCERINDIQSSGDCIVDSVVSDRDIQLDAHSLLRPVCNHVGSTGTLHCDDKQWKPDQRAHDKGEC